MRNVSNKYIETMRARRDFYAVAEITFSDGSQKTLSKNDFAVSGNYIKESAETYNFPLGVFAAKRINISLINDDDRWSYYDFYGAKIFLQTKFDLGDGTTETLNIGTFTVITPENYGTTISITAMDDSYKTDIDYSTGLSYPISAGEALRDSCQTCGITLQTPTFKNSDYVIPSMPQKLTHRQFIGMIAMIAGGNAVMDEHNRLMIKSYDFSEFEKPGLDGGIFDTGTPRYETGDDADGGSFKPWDTGDEVDGGKFGDRDNIHMLYEFKSGITIGVDDVVITGVQITDDEKNVHLYGSDGYVLSLENQLATGKEDKVVRLIGQAIAGLRFRPFSGDHIAYPLAEFMDLAYLFDRKNNIYRTVLTDVSFNYYGFTTLKCTADSPIRNSSKYYGNETKAIVQARQMVEKEKNSRELAIEKLQETLANSSGLYPSEERQPDGSTIYYLHDKPTKAESKAVIELTSEAIGISQDGGKTYPWGVTFTGEAILEKIYTVGLDADYINTGTFEIRKGDKVMVLMDKDTGKVVLRPDIFELSSGKTIDSISEEKANAAASGALESANGYTDKSASTTLESANKHSDSAANNALDSAKDYTDTTAQSTLKSANEHADKAANDAVNGLSQMDVLNKLTNGGVDKGIYLKDGKLYISFNAALGGELTLGGASNGNGRLSIRNASEKEVGYIDNAGVNFEQGVFSGTLSGGTVTGSTITGGTITTGNNFYVNTSGKIFSRSPQFYSNIYMSPTIQWDNKEEEGLSVLALPTKKLLMIGDGDMDSIQLLGNAYVYGTLGSLSTKSRIVKTKNYDNRLLYCYEMPSPMFGDIGEGITDENGECYIYLDDVFSETVSAQIEYQVFLQKEGMGDVWVEEKNPQYFVVKGTENLKFAWEIKAKQRDYEYEHMEIFEENPEEPEKINYESIYDTEIKELIKEREDLYNETA